MEKFVCADACCDLFDCAGGESGVRSRISQSCVEVVIHNRDRCDHEVRQFAER